MKNSNSHKNFSELSDENRRLLVEFLHDETLHQDTQIRANMSQIYQFGILAFAVLAAAAPILAQQEQYIALLALAPIVPIVWLMGIRSLAELFLVAANRNWLENRLSILVNDAGAGLVFVPWENVAGKLALKSIANFSVFFGFFLAGLAVCVGSLAYAWQTLPHLRTWTTLDIAICGILIGAAIASGIQIVFNVHKLEKSLDVARTH